jgi:hypothetical protein
MDGGSDDGCPFEERGVRAGHSKVEPLQPHVMLCVYNI